MWAILYMNVIYLVFAAIFIFLLIKKYYGPKFGFLGGLMTILNGGVHAHAFASQMEVAIVFCFTVFLYLLDLSENKKNYSRNEGLIQMSFDGKISPEIQVSVSLTSIHERNPRSCPI